MYIQKKIMLNAESKERVVVNNGNLSSTLLKKEMLYESDSWIYCFTVVDSDNEPVGFGDGDFYFVITADNETAYYETQTGFNDVDDWAEVNLSQGKLSVNVDLSQTASILNGKKEGTAYCELWYRGDAERWGLIGKWMVTLINTLSLDEEVQDDYSSSSSSETSSSDSSDSSGSSISSGSSLSSGSSQSLSSGSSESSSSSSVDSSSSSSTELNTLLARWTFDGETVVPSHVNSLATASNVSASGFTIAYANVNGGQALEFNYGDDPSPTSYIQFTLGETATGYYGIYEFAFDLWSSTASFGILYQVDRSKNGGGYTTLTTGQATPNAWQSISVAENQEIETGDTITYRIYFFSGDPENAVFRVDNIRLYGYEI